jgi:phospholipase C
LIRFLERRFAPHHPGLIETNITQWRRTVCGDLTSAVDFKNARPAPVQLPDTSAYQPLNHDRFPDYVPEPPANQSLPKQERGLKRARALPYSLDVDANVSRRGDALRLEFKNRGRAGACFQVRAASGTEGPWSYTVEAGKSLTNTWALHGKFDFTVHGPNGFLRRYLGDGRRNAADFDVDVRLDPRDYTVTVRVTNQTHEKQRVRIESAYGHGVFEDWLPRGRMLEKCLQLRSSHGWYDLLVRTDAGDFVRQAAGHLENGQDSASDPAFTR